MQLNSLPGITTRSKKRVGRGHGSGRGKTGGRGTKGQKARHSISLFFEGGAVPLIKRIPFRRGKGRNKVFRKKTIVVNVKFLNILPSGTVVDVDSLIKHNIIDAQIARECGVKILGDGKLSVPLTVKLPVSSGARKKIEEAGGKVEHE